MPTFKVPCVLTFDGPDEQQVLEVAMDVTEMVSAQLEDEKSSVTLEAFSFDPDGIEVE